MLAGMRKPEKGSNGTEISRHEIFSEIWVYLAKCIPEIREQPENAEPMVHLPRAPDCRFINFNILGQNSLM